MSAYLSRDHLELVSDDGATVRIEAGDYLEAVDPFASPLTLRQREAWVSCLRRAAQDGASGAAGVVLEARGRYVYARLTDLLLVEEA